MKQNKYLIRIFAVILAAVLALSFVSCTCTDNGEDGGYFEKLDLIDSLFNAYSLFELDEEALMDAILKGYVEGTGDKYAEYFTADEYAALNADGRGELVGIGISVTENADRNLIEILNVMPDSPALEAGLLSGDLITHIGAGENKRSVNEVGYTNALELMRGEEGSVAEITIERDGETIEFSIIRKKVTAYSVYSHVCESAHKRRICGGFPRLSRV